MIAPWPADVPPPAQAPPGDPQPPSLAPSWEDAAPAPHRPQPPPIPQRAEVLRERDRLPARTELLEAMLARLRANPPPATRMLTVYRYAPPEAPRLWYAETEGDAMHEIESMGHFTAIGMRVDAPPGAVVIDTCSGNDTANRGNDHNWTFSNPTNRAIVHEYEDARAVSLEALWQGTKAIAGRPCPDPLTLAGDWRRGKAQRPTGAYAGPGKPLIASPGEARRRIYIPAFARLIEHWLQDPEVADRVARAQEHSGPIFLRDWDTGRGIDRNAPMSHAWALCVWLNSGAWPT